MPKPRNRIDEKGQYCPISGTTVVSAIQASDTQFWRMVYNHLKNCPTICRYYAPLPYTSYHMTAIALDTIDDVSQDENWPAFINEKMPFYSELHKALSAQKIVPNIRFDFLSEFNLIVLAVSLPPEQVEAIQNMAKRHDCKNGIPMNFHITLAYQYDTNLTREDCDKINEELEPLRRLFAQKKRIKLDPPKLCYFNNMTHFTPWDGSTNPFIIPPSKPSLFSDIYSSVLSGISGFFLGQPPQSIVADEQQKHTSKP